MSKWLRKDDPVVVIAGNERGKTGKVLARSSDRVVIEGINIRKKHMKRRSQVQQSQIVEIPCPIHLSNVSYVDPEGKKVKLSVRFHEGVKQLVYKSNGKDVVVRDI